jgi:hypothetical protein
MPPTEQAEDKDKVQLLHEFVGKYVSIPGAFKSSKVMIGNDDMAPLLISYPVENKIMDAVEYWTEMLITPEDLFRLLTKILTGDQTKTVFKDFIKEMETTDLYKDLFKTSLGNMNKTEAQSPTHSESKSKATSSSKTGTEPKSVSMSTPQEKKKGKSDSTDSKATTVKEKQLLYDNYSGNKMVMDALEIPAQFRTKTDDRNKVATVNKWMSLTNTSSVAELTEMIEEEYESNDE